MNSNDLKINIVYSDVLSNGIFLFFKKFSLGSFTNDTNLASVFYVFFVDKSTSFIDFFGCNFRVFRKISIDVIITGLIFTYYLRSGSTKYTSGISRRNKFHFRNTLFDIINIGKFELYSTSNFKSVVGNASPLCPNKHGVHCNVLKLSFKTVIQTFCSTRKCNVDKNSPQYTNHSNDSTSFVFRN